MMPESFDLTPTWSGLVQGMLGAHSEISRMEPIEMIRNDYWKVKELAELEKQFAKMALAADLWNDHVEALKKEKTK